MVQDILVSVQFAARHGLKVAARGSGHQLAGLALPEAGLVIDMSKLNKISYDPATQTATVQARHCASFLPSAAAERCVQ